MSVSARQEQYLSLMERFVGKDLKASSFCTQFTIVWTQDRDRVYAKKADWPQPYDELLLAEWQRGEISENKFQRESANLWGDSDNVEFRNIINKIHSACRVFSPSPELQWEIDEEQLRHEVEKAVASYEKLSRPTAQVAF